MNARSDEQAAVLVLTKASPGEWHRADLIAEAGSATVLLEGRAHLYTEDHKRYARDLLARADSVDLAGAAGLIEQMATQGIRLVVLC